MAGFGFVRSLVLPALAAASLGACAADTGPAPDAADSDAEEIRIGTGYRYECSRTVSGRTDHVSVALTKKVSQLTLVSYLDDQQRTRVSRFMFDSSYAPKTNTNYVRFSRVSGPEYPNTILAYVPMRTGASAGSVKLQSGGDSFSSLYYSCKRTTSVLDTGEPAPHAASANAVAALGSGSFYADPPSAQTPAEASLYVYSLMLSPDGTYLAYNTNAVSEMGVWTAGGSKSPLTLSLQSGSYKWTATVSKGKLVWTRGKLTATLAGTP